MPFDAGRIEPRTAPPVRVVATLPVDRSPRGDGRWALDGGQNISGWVRLTVRGRRGDTVTVRHAEVLEPDGSLHTRALRSARATDTYVLADDETGHARARVHLPRLPLRRGRDDRRAPRRGDGGDQQRHAPARRLRVLGAGARPAPRERGVVAARQLRVGADGLSAARRATGLDRAMPRRSRTPRRRCSTREAFWRSWLRDLALDQHPTLGVPTVVPDVVIDGEPRFGRAGWADAATIVPWSVYEAYGDPSVLADQRDSMAHWLESLVGAARAGRAAPTIDAVRRLARSGCAIRSTVEGEGRLDVHRERLLRAQCPTRRRTPLGCSATARSRSARAGACRRRRAADVGHAGATTPSTTQTGCAVALQLGVAPERGAAGGRRHPGAPRPRRRRAGRDRVPRHAARPAGPREVRPLRRAPT